MPLLNMLVLVWAPCLQGVTGNLTHCACYLGRFLSPG